MQIHCDLKIKEIHEMTQKNRIFHWFAHMFDLLVSFILELLEEHLFKHSSDTDSPF